jgi:glycerol 3-phosphatase-2
VSDASVTRGSWIIDLDGVVWLTGIALPGAAAALRRLADVGVRPLFVTNNSAPSDDELMARLERAGIAATPEDLVTSAHAAAQVLEPGESVFVLADEGVRDALVQRGVHIVEEGPCDAVVVGWTHEFTFDLLARASTLVRGGARLIATNDDATHPTPDGLLPGAGALVSAVATASGALPLIAGKPHAPMVECIASRRDDVVLVVGDRQATDGELARSLKVPFALVYSGVTAPGAALDWKPQFEATDLAALVQIVTAN